MSRPADASVTALLKAFDRHVREHGPDATMALLRTRRDALAGNDGPAPAGGRPMVDDGERLDRIAWHLAHDTDLHELGRAGKPILSEAARRSIRDLPAPGDTRPDGTVNPHAWRRLVRKFVWFCLDVPGRGFDEGEIQP